MTTSSEFPTLDADRTAATAEYGRVVVDVLAPVEAHIPERDDWITLPVRLAHSQANGLYVELGPYDLNTADIHALRQAIAAYDAARGDR